MSRNGAKQMVFDSFDGRKEGGHGVVMFLPFSTIIVIQDNVFFKIALFS